MDVRQAVAHINHLFAMTAMPARLINVNLTEPALTPLWIVMITTPARMTSALQEIALILQTLVMTGTLVRTPIVIQPADVYSLL